MGEPPHFASDGYYGERGRDLQALASVYDIGVRAVIMTRATTIV